MPLLRRDFLQAALGFGLAPLMASRVSAGEERQGVEAMAKDIVMIHGANEGAWVFDRFKAAFEELGWNCHAPDLIGHGLNSDTKSAALVGVGMADYLNELESFLKTLGPQPVLLGHSMGARPAARGKGTCSRDRPGRPCPARGHPPADRQ